jgi:hypothetical protein
LVPTASIPKTPTKASEVGHSYISVCVRFPLHTAVFFFKGGAKAVRYSSPGMDKYDSTEDQAGGAEGVQFREERPAKNEADKRIKERRGTGLEDY